MWLMGVVIRRWVESMGVANGRGYQEVGGIYGCG